MPQLSQEFFQKILQMEGGYQNLTNDNGNYACGKLAGTNRGVSAIAYYEYTGRCPSVSDMMAIDNAFAWSFYNWYWDKFRIDEIEDFDIANLVMNNFMGAPLYAAQSLQRALNRFGYNLAVDGKMGSKTIAATNDAVRQNKAKTYNAIREEWIAYLQNVTWAAALTARVNRHFPAWSETESADESIAAGASFQEARIVAALRGAADGDWSDIGFLILVFMGLLATILAAVQVIAILKAT